MVSQTSMYGLIFQQKGTVVKRPYDVYAHAQLYACTTIHNTTLRVCMPDVHRMAYETSHDVRGVYFVPVVCGM